MHPTNRNAVVLAVIVTTAIVVGAYLLMSRIGSEVVPSPIRTNYTGTGMTFSALPTAAPVTNPAVTTRPAAPSHPLIRVTLPPFGQALRSPLVVSGEARGNWFFEASVPVRLLDANGKVLGITNAQAEGNWMTEDFVPFRATIPFIAPTTLTGTLVLEKSNASGLPEHADELRIPVSFDPSILPKRMVKLYYYDARKDKDASGNPRCEASGLTAVERSIPLTVSPIQDTVKLLLKGEIASVEKAQGISSEYPLPGFELKGAVLKDGILTLSFSDPQGKTVGGSCRVGILWAQIERTVKQFSTVKEVRFQPDTLFQP